MVYFLCKVYDSDRQNCYFALSLPMRGAWIEIVARRAQRDGVRQSLPMRGAWIEMRLRACRTARMALASLPMRGAWIEISPMLLLASTAWSLPMRGAWIEMFRYSPNVCWFVVAPHAGSVD